MTDKTALFTNAWFHSLPGTPAIYLITCLVNGKKYIGQARNIRKRAYEHRKAINRRSGERYDQKTAIASAIKKYGIANFNFEIIENCAEDQLNEREVHWIAHHGSMVPEGYNLTTGGRSFRFAPGVAAKISAANKGKIKTPEWRARLSASHMGKIISAEQRRKTSKRHRGTTHSPEHRQKQRMSMLGKNTGPRTPEHRAAISAGMSKGGHARSVAASQNPEALARNAAARRGQKRSPEQCARIAAGQRKKWQSVSKDERRSYMRALVAKRKSWTPSEETKRKISETLIARNATIRAQAEMANG